jgi:hypothetical protein
MQKTLIQGQKKNFQRGFDQGHKQIQNAGRISGQETLQWDSIAGLKNQLI